MLKVLSLGAGVQSSTLALMAAHGEIGPIDFAVFADTGAEPKKVYEWLDWLEPKLPFPVHRVQKVNLAEASLRVRVSAKGNAYTQYAIPVFIDDGNGKAGLGMRQCTRDTKIKPIISTINRLRKGQPVTQLIGISFDELQRMRVSQTPWITNSYPLVDRGIRRHACLEWMERHGYPRPPRSACVFCPYHSDAEWRRLRDEEPEEFAAAGVFEAKYQDAFAQTRFRGKPFLHRSLKPLAEVDLEAGVNDKQAAFTFGMQNECEGMCGV